MPSQTVKKIVYLKLKDIQSLQCVCGIDFRDISLELAPNCAQGN